MVHIARKDVRQREDHLRNIDPPDEGLVVDDRGRGDGDRLLDHQPGGQTGKKKNRIVGHLELDDSGENESQDEEVKKRVEDRPEEAKDGIAVAELELGQGEVKKEITVLDELQKISFHLAVCFAYSIIKKRRPSFAKRENRPVGLFFFLNTRMRRLQG